MNSIVAIVGAWELVSFKVQKDDGTIIYPFGENAKGTIIYTDSGHFSVQLMRSSRPNFVSGDQMKGTPEEIAASYMGCISYYGYFDLNDANGYVVHNIKGSLFPNWEGQDQKRFFELSGDCLTLTTPPTLWGGSEIIGVIAWERLK